MYSNTLDKLFQDLVFFRNGFDTRSIFSPVVTKKEVDYPLNMKYDDENFIIEIAAIGVNRKDVDITAQDDILSVCYQRPDVTDDGYSYKYRGITQKSFRFDWKVSPQLDIDATRADMKDGLLVLTIPIIPEKPESKSKKIPL